MKEYLNAITSSVSLKVLLVFIVLDVIFGVLRAIKEKSLNSTIGIDGIIRKFGMIIASIGFVIIDTLVGLNFVGFLPTSVLEILPMEEIGTNQFFNVLFATFEMLSILKNMYKCGIPIPKKVQNLLKTILKEFTSEIKES